MRTWCLALVLGFVALTSGCSSSSATCDEPKRYQEAREGVRIDAPDDLDELQESVELKIPKASPRDERPSGSPCLELPPSLLSDS